MRIRWHTVLRAEWTCPQSAAFEIPPRPNRRGEDTRALPRWVGRGVPAESGIVESRSGSPRTLRATDFGLVRPRCRESGILLIECLTYLAVWFVVTGLALTTFYRAWENSRSLARYTEDMARALKTGERWRAEVRQATGPLKLVSEPGIPDQALHIPGAGGEIVYFCTGTNLLRRVGEAGPWTVLLPAVKTSRMLPDARSPVVSWRWELELASSPKRPTRLRPLLSFQAVPGPKAKP